MTMMDRSGNQFNPPTSMTNEKIQDHDRRAGMTSSDTTVRNNSTGALPMAHNNNSTVVANANTRHDDDNKNSNNIPPIYLSTYWHEWSRCLGSRYQMDQLYRYGKMDNCSKQWKDLQLAINARYVALSDPAEAHRLIQTTTYQKRLKISPTAGSIWELKSEPGWN